jgi:hypothetical protein
MVWDELKLHKPKKPSEKETFCWCSIWDM